MNVCRYDRTKFLKWLHKAKQAAVPLMHVGMRWRYSPTDIQPQQSVWVSGQGYASATLPLGKESLLFIQYVAEWVP